MVYGLVLVLHAIAIGHVGLLYVLVLLATVLMALDTTLMQWGALSMGLGVRTPRYIDGEGASACSCTEY